MRDVPRETAVGLRQRVAGEARPNSPSVTRQNATKTIVQDATFGLTCSSFLHPRVPSLATYAAVEACRMGALPLAQTYAGESTWMTRLAMNSFVFRLYAAM
jgi:hypothetical protein